MHKQVVDVASKEINVKKTIVRIFQSDHRSRNVENEVFPDNLTKKYYFTKEFMDQFVSSTHKNRINEGLDLYCSKENKISNTII